MRKIIQISTASETDGHHSICSALFALCDDGTVWQREWQEPVYEPTGILSRKEVKPGRYRWLSSPAIPQD